MTSMLKKDFNLTIKIEEILLQEVILMNISEKYTSFISTIKKKQTDATKNPSNKIFQIIKHSEIMKINARVKIHIQNGIHRASKRNCTNCECMKKGLTTHYTDCCSI